MLVLNKTNPQKNKIKIKNKLDLWRLFLNKDSSSRVIVIK